MRKLFGIVLIVALVYGSIKAIDYIFSQPIVSDEKPITIDIKQEPIQTMVKDEVTLYEDPEISFKAVTLAEYTISAKVLDASVNAAYGEEGIYPIDLALIWGDAAESGYDNYFVCYYERNGYFMNTNRTLWTDFKSEPPNGWSREYIRQHVSNNHIFPANENLYNAIKWLKKGQQVQLSGYLIRAYVGANQKDSSLSRTDSDCEDFYVSKIQIEDKVYH